MAGGLYPVIEQARIHKSEHHAAFLAAAADDDALRRLFPDIDERFGRARWYRPSFLAWQLVSAAHWNAWLDLKSDPAEIEHAALTALAVMRQACVDRAVTMTAVVGLAFSLPPETAVATPFGRLTALGARHQRLVAAMGSEYPLPEYVSVLEAPIRVPIDVEPTGHFVNDQMPAAQEVGAHSIALAALLAAGEGSLRPTLDIFCTRISPIAAGVGGYSWRKRLIEGPRFSNDFVSTLSGWIELIHRHPIPEIATERLLAISTNTSEHMYAFIDSVIVWENLFGAGGTQELSFRVALNMALVLSDDPRERHRLFDRVRKLYNQRSGIVHGGQKLRASESLDVRRETWRLSLAAVKRLLTSFPALLSESGPGFVRLALGDRGAETTSSRDTA